MKRCGDNMMLSLHEMESPVPNVLISHSSSKTPAGGGSGGRMIVTGNWEEECRQSIAARWEEECAAASLVADKGSVGFRQSRAGAPSPRFDISVNSMTNDYFAVQ